MPLTDAGRKVLKLMISKRGEKSGTKMFYMSINKGVPGSSKWHEIRGGKKARSKYTAGLAK